MVLFCVFLFLVGGNLELLYLILVMGENTSSVALL